MNKIAVICDKDTHFKDFLDWVFPDDRSGFVRVSEVEQVFSHWFSKVIRIGPYWKLRNHEEIYHQAMQRVK